VRRTAQDFSTYVDAARVVVNLHIMRGEIADADRVAREAAARARADGNLPIAWAATLELADARLQYLNDTAAVVQRLDAVRREIAGSTVEAIDRPYLTLAHRYAAAGREADARAMLTRYRAETPAEYIRRDTLDQAIVQVLAQFQQKRFREVRALAESLPAMDPSCATWCWSGMLARLYDGLGMPDSTLAHAERHLQARGADRIFVDPEDLAWVLKRSGELYESRGETAKAIERYRELVDLWRTADAPLQPLVADLKQRIARLEAKRG
jgi:tetratricopeptide (TPR) repeat protein